MSFWIRYRALAVLMLLMGIPYLFFMVVFPLWELPFDVVVNEVWYRWQALNAGGLALLGATLVLFTHHQTETARQLEQAQKNRRYWEKAFRPIDDFVGELRRDIWIAAMPRQADGEVAERFSFHDRLRRLGQLRGVLSAEFSEDAYRTIYEYLRDIMIDIHHLRNGRNVGPLAVIGNYGIIERLERIQSYVEELRLAGLYKDPELPDFELRVTPDDVF